jgi:hypothetical protein
MESFTKTLIECYAKYAVENVDQCKEYKTLCNENKDDTLFNKERERIERLKRDIEKEVDQKSSTSSDLIINALKLLNKKFSRKGSPKSKEDVEYIYKLILKTYSSHWREDQKDYFKNVYKAITTYMDYFLSFTKRKSTPNLKNIVNSHHMYFIRAILHWSEEKFEKENEKDKNLLAEAINYLLRSHKQQLRGFYYPEHEHDNQKVKEKLRDASGKTFAFVQIIQNVMLSKSFPCEPNYCFFEYCEAKRNISDDKRLFILAEGSRKDTIANGDYWENFDTWYNEIKGKDQLILEHTEDSYNSEQIARLRRVIKKNLLDKVSETKRKMINEVPP